MRVTMDERGVITIQADNGAEAYALSAWYTNSSIEIDDAMRCEKHYIRGSMLKLIARDEVGNDDSGN